MKPLTMTEADEREDRAAVVNKSGSWTCDPYRLECAWAEVDALRAALADERKHADELADRVAHVMERDREIAGDPRCEPALQDEHKTGPRNDYTLASLLDAHAARRAKEANE